MRPERKSFLRCLAIVVSTISAMVLLLAAWFFYSIYKQSNPPPPDLPEISAHTGLCFPRDAKLQHSQLFGFKDPDMFATVGIGKSDVNPFIKAAKIDLGMVATPRPDMRTSPKRPWWNPLAVKKFVFLDGYPNRNVRLLISLDNPDKPVVYVHWWTQ